ncbi:hypothetical protein L211DRAFT_87801 [Terfezia boudieri ATCC MYA-4762]|uniref:Uncharacterized protein n=1 Tax=Terfezia boudieri ATCC MYA-4762 TaxID=1051890 RepID=A0A3N4LY01_9PEZI|nr:hypothetical protein L211DRAFT_87801 [Terfezia boudieri ATCC MYA-4762]
MPSSYIPPPPRPNCTFSGVNLSSPQSSSHKSTLTSGPIEAGSLSSITPIADDPPLQFIVPPLAESSREEKYPKPALVLYFVRVPGSRDLFLTSMHPLKNTVTAQDVEGCLFYVHVHGEGEDNRGQSQGEGERPPLSSTGSTGSIGSGSGSSKWSARILHRPGRREDMKGFSMTVIRRDPATGTQWNVAHISSRGAGVQILSQGGTLPPPPIVMSLPGKGYKKFMPPASARRKPVPRQGQLQYNLPPLPPPPQAPVGMHQGRAILAEEEEAYFRRKRDYAELVAARDREIQDLEAEQAGRDTATAIVEEERGLVREVVWDCAAQGAGDKWWKMGMSRTKNLRATSSGSMLHGHSGGGSAGSGGEQDKTDKDHWKGYAFDALWAPVGNAGSGEKMGTCRFKDAAGGKIMKCKYYPASGRPSYLVSAVEFKLPSSGVFHHRSRSASPSISTSQSPEGLGMDEGAGGGGYGGKAKMGTIVVHNVGMEMLDLVISANVGLFWRKWERWVGERGALGQLEGC